jgi:chlorite dismutase
MNLGRPGTCDQKPATGTTYSFGLDDQDFVQELRETESSNSIG